jgi:hypothetical protein
VLPEELYQITSTDTWQATVGYHQIEEFSRAGHEFPTSFTITGRDDSVTCIPQHTGHQRAEHSFVVYYQDPEGQLVPDTQSDFSVGQGRRTQPDKLHRSRRRLPGP